MIKQEKSIKEMFKNCLVSHTKLSLEKARQIAKQVEELDRQTEAHKKYVEEQKINALKNANHACNVRMLQQILSEANNTVPDNIRAASLINDKSMCVEFNEDTLYGKSHVYVGKRLDNFTVKKYEEGLQEALRAISTDALYDIASYTEKLGLKFHNNYLTWLVGKGSEAELNPLIYWSDYSAYYANNKYRFLAIEIIRMTATSTGVDIVFKVKPEGIYALRWWAIDTNRFPYILDYVSNGGNMIAFYLGI